jgi:hypothetical protein
MTSVPMVVGCADVPSSSPESSDTAVSFVNVEPKSAQTTGRAALIDAALLQGLLEVRDEVLDRLDADRKPYKIPRHLERRAHR